MTGWDEIQNGWGEIQTPSGGSSLPDLTGNTGKVLTVNAGETGTEWAVGPAPAAAGADTQVLFNDGGAIAGDAGLTFDKTTNGLSSTGPLTLTPAADVVPLTARAYSSGTGHIAQFQASDNSPLSHIAHDGTFVGNVTGNVSGSSGSTTGNAATASDGLTSASGTAPLTLTLAAKALTGSVANMSGDAGAGGTAGLVPAQAAGDATKYLRGDATWQTVAGGGGITNGAGANVITKSDGTNLVASTVTDNGTTLTSTGSGGVSLTNGSAGYKISVSGQPVVSLGRDSSLGGPLLKIDATGVMSLTASTARLPSNGMLGFTVGTVSQDLDTFFRRRAAANPAWGVAAASPVAYRHTLAADARGTTDSNVSGADAVVTPGMGTGALSSTAADRRGDFRVQVQTPAAAATTLAVGADRLVVAGQRVALTESSATPVLDVAVAAGSVAGGTLFYTIHSDDATDFQAVSGSIPFTVVNKAGTLTATVGTATESVAVSSGTLTNTVTATTGAGIVTLNLNAVSSLTQTTLFALVTAQLHGTGVATTK